MSYSNEFLRNFRPVFLAILKAQSFRPERVELVVIDEEQSHVLNRRMCAMCSNRSETI